MRTTGGFATSILGGSLLPPLPLSPFYGLSCGTSTISITSTEVSVCSHFGKFVLLLCSVSRGLVALGLGLLNVFPGYLFF